MFCAFCMNQEKKGNLHSERNKEQAYITIGVNSWKKAPKCFQDHQETNCHNTAACMEILVPKCGDAKEMSDKAISDSRETERKHLINVIRCLRFLSRQGIAIQGNTDKDNFTQLLLLLGTKDPTIITNLNKVRLKYTHHDIQNEILDIMSQHIIREKLREIQKNRFYCIMADEYRDITNLEQLSFCLRSVTDTLDVQEDFLGFYQVNDIKSETLVHTIKDILVRFNLPINDCRGQTYDGASNMLGKKSGVATQIKAIQPKAIVTHCHGHSLSLAVKDLTSSNAVLSDTMGTVGEICVLVKYSPKRENILDSLKTNVEGEVTEADVKKHLSLDKLCTTRWTVRATCFNKILEKYGDLQNLWDICLAEKLDSETKSRIIGCQAQMRSFPFFFGLCISHRLYILTDNLSKTLQKEKMSALESKHLADLTVETLNGMRSDEHFNLFFQSVKVKAVKFDIESPCLPRKRRRPKYSILQFVHGHEETSNKTGAYNPGTVEDHFRQIYYDALDTIIAAIDDRFEQPSFQFFLFIEQLLLKAIKEVSYEEPEMLYLKQYYDDINVSALPAEFQILKTVCSDSKIVNFQDIVEKLQSLTVKRNLLPNVFTLVKLLLVGAATSATPERSFSMARRLKTWLRSSMSQKRLNSLAILSTYHSLVDRLSLIDVAQEFVNSKLA